MQVITGQVENNNLTSGTHLPNIHKISRLGIEDSLVYIKKKKYTLKVEKEA